MYTGNSKDDNFGKKGQSYRNVPRIQSVMLPNTGQNNMGLPSFLQHDSLVRSPSNENIIPKTLKLRVEYKTYSVSIDTSPTDLVSAILDKSIEQFPDKVKKVIVDKALYYSPAGIYLPLNRQLDSLFLKEGDVITFKKKDKKLISVEINILGKENATVVVSSNTTALGLLYLLGPKPDFQINSVSVFSSKGKKIDHKDKLNAKRGDSFEIKIDNDRRDGKLPTSTSSGSLFSGMMRKARSTLRYSQKPKLDNPDDSKKSWKKQEKETLSIFLQNRPSETELKQRNILIEQNPTNLHAEVSNIISNFLANRPSESVLKEKHILVDYNPAPRNIVTVVADPNAVPPLKLSIIKQLLVYIKSHVHIVGIFRVSGQLDVVKSLYDQAWNQSIQIPNNIDPHAVSSTLKMYLRKQPEPLIPFSLYDKFIAAERTDDNETKISELKEIVKLMPEPNGSILKELIKTLVIVSNNKDVNMMGPQNLGIVFGPTIMWSQDTNIMDFSSTGYQSSLVNTLIEEYSNIWGEEVETEKTEQPTQPSEYLNNNQQESIEDNEKLNKQTLNESSYESIVAVSEQTEEDIGTQLLSKVTGETALKLLQKDNLDDCLTAMDKENLVKIIKNLLMQIKE